MADRKRVYPGGYTKLKQVEGTCSSCETEPIARGNRFLCLWCYTDPDNREDRPDRNAITEEDAEYLAVKVAEIELTPPTPVKHFSRDSYSQEELQAILNGD